MRQEDRDSKFDLIQKKIDGFISDGNYDLVLNTLFNEILLQRNQLKLAKIFLRVSKLDDLELYWKPKYDEQNKKYVGGYWNLFDFVQQNKNNLDKKVISILKHSEGEMRLKYADSQASWDVAAEGVFAWPENQDLLIFLIELAEVGFCDDGFYVDKMEELVERQEFPKSTFEYIKEIVKTGEENIN